MCSDRFADVEEFRYMTSGSGENSGGIVNKLENACPVQIG